MGKSKDLIGEFAEAYEGILRDAEQAAETTRTDAWHAMYQRFADETKTEALEIAKGLDMIAGASRAGIVTSDIVKDLSGLKKRFEELRERMESFKRDTVNPIRLPFDQANHCITEYQGRAASEHEAGGMYTKDIEDRMADAIAAQPKVRWNEKIGSIQIVAAAKPA